MTLTGWAHLAAVVVVLAWWWDVLGHIREWQDRQRDFAKARQHQVHWFENDWRSAVGRIPNRWVWGLGLTTLAVLGAVTWRYPHAVAVAVGARLLVTGLRAALADPEHIARTRAALGQVMGLDGKSRPPRIRQHGEHPAGGPLQLTVAAMPGFADWDEGKRKKVEQVIENTLLGDWECVEWPGDGTSVWERQPELPPRLLYSAHHDDLPWYQLPSGDNGAGGVRVMDLTVHAHAIVAGNTGSGKTSGIRGWSAHLLHHGVQVAAIDENRASLAYLEGREGVVLTSLDGLESAEQGLKWLDNEYEERLLLLRSERKYRPPLVAFVEEVETLFDDARRFGERRPKAKMPEAIAIVLRAARLWRKVDMHLILITQQPPADTIPTAIRTNCRGRVAFGPLEQKVAEMMFERKWARAVATPEIAGRSVVKCGADIGPSQFSFFADPDDEKHDPEERKLAASLLPARREPLRGTSTDGMTDHSEHSAPLTAPRKWAPDPAVIPGASEAGQASHARRPASTAEERERERKDRHAATERKRVARLREEMKRDPLHRKHGTREGHRICPTRCDWCVNLRRPNLVEVPK